MAKYGKHSRETIRVQLEHHGYDIEEMREMTQEERIMHVVSAAFVLRWWFRKHFITKTPIEYGFRILDAINNE